MNAVFTLRLGCYT